MAQFPIFAYKAVESLQHNTIVDWAYRYVHNWCFEGQLRERERERERNEEDETKKEKQDEEGDERNKKWLIVWIWKR